ncbi:MAG: hypothetical protein AAF639_29575, partial [Chloroflexota bacterium]
MKAITVNELYRNFFTIIEEILTTGIPLEINIKGRRLRLVPVDDVAKVERVEKSKKADKLQNLVYRPNAIKGDPDDI